MKKNLFFVLGLIFNLILNAQETPPEVSRFLQVNTYNGGQLSHVSVDDKNNGYICGIANGKNFNFDGNNFSPVGIDDLFVLKTNSIGTTQWFKTVNASSNGVISCSKSFINPSGEVYVSGSFIGNISFGGNSISTTATSYYLLKYDLEGNEKWIKLVDSPIVDLANENNSTFVTYGQNHIAKLDDTTGEILNLKSFFNLNIKALEIRNSNLYMAGQANQFESFGSESETVYKNNGFVLKTDLDFNFNDLVRLVPSGWNEYYISSINDIRFLSDGSLAITGVSNNKVLLGLDWERNISANNETNFTTNGGYILLAKINENLDNLQWFLTGTNMDSNFNMNVVDDKMENLEIFPYGSSWFRVMFKKKISDSSQFNLPSGPLVSSGRNAVMFIIGHSGADFGATDVASSLDESFAYGISSNNTNSFYLNYYKSNTITHVYNENGNWFKAILNSEYGSLSSKYIKHTGTDGSLINYNYHCGKTNYFGAIINNLGTCSDILSKTAPDGKLVWKSQINATSQTDVYASRTSDLADTNGSGENVVVSQFTHTAEFVDNSNVKSNFGRHNNIFNYVSLITNTNSNGTLKWAKTLEPTSVDAKIKYTSVTYDNNGNVVLAGVTNDTFLVDDLAYNFNKKEVLFLMKLDANTGQVLFAKQFTDMGAYMLNLDTDNENNIYLSYEPMLYNQTTGFYNFGSVQVPISASDLNHFFIKFDSNGNTLLGKNFYANNSATDYDYSWPLSLKFDGTDFIISGEMYSQNKTSYKGIDGQIYTNPYPTYNISDFIAKVDKSGNIIWHKPIFANNRITQNKADVDELGNIYYYFGAMGKINIDGNETSFSANQISAALIKLSATDGSLKYLKNFGVHNSFTYIYNSSLSVLQNDILSISGNLNNQDRFIYPINNHNASNYYIATLGKLPTPYLTPENDYLLVTNIEVPNNITDNNGEFDLITNVDWTATSNQSWLTLSSEKYTLKTSNSASISGSGDHKIMLSAAQNITGNPRSAIITITGNGVTSKEIEVMQSGLLGISQIKERNLLLYPNPTSDYINFSEEVKETSIFDSLGRLVKTAKATSKINISDLPSGIYVVMTTDKYGMSKTTKIIKK